MSDFAEMFIRAARAIDAARTAEEYAHQVDEGIDIPRHAAQHHWDASSVLRVVGEKFIDEADQHAFAARRYEKAERDELRTGVEYRAGGDAA